MLTQKCGHFLGSSVFYSPTLACGFELASVAGAVTVALSSAGFLSLASLQYIFWINNIEILIKLF